MRIDCCHCGPRAHEEFTYLGDATVARPASSLTAGASLAAPNSNVSATAISAADAALVAATRLASPTQADASRGGATHGSAPTTRSTDLTPWHDYVYLRDNPAGPHRELWQHVGGCRAWLVVTRNIATHEILAVELARNAALQRQPASGSHE